MALEQYRRMRDFGRTSEPAGKVRKRAGWSFVVQKHDASHLHYDFRLELDGVLKSWAIPKGPSFDVHDRRLAVQTEDHPVEYGSFEGTIPEGEYGGGTVMLWDRGTWEPIGDPHAGLAKGHLDFELKGERLEGRWMLVRLRARPGERAGRSNWMLIKRSDAHADPARDVVAENDTSVTTGRSMDAIAGASGRKKKVWHSNRSDAAPAGETSLKARIRAAAREGRAKSVKSAAAAKGTTARKGSAREKKIESDGGPRKWEITARGDRAAPAKRNVRGTNAAARTVVAGIAISNGDRIVDAQSGSTKPDVARYYEAVSESLLSHAAGRPLALVRCPDGSSGACFFQKHSHPGMSEHIHREVEPEGEEVLSVTDVRGLVSLAQWGVLELHGWGALLESLERPDWIVMDLDPGPDVGWSDVVDAALEMRERLDAIGLTSFVKTTGGKGLHVVLPLTRRHDWDTVKSFAQALALDAVEREPDRFVAVMSKQARKGKIFVDYLRNGRGATAVLPYSARARDGLPVAMPISWEDLRRGVDPAAFDIASVPQRLARRKKDPWSALPRTRQSITKKVLAALERQPL